MSKLTVQDTNYLTSLGLPGRLGLKVLRVTDRVRNALRRQPEVKVEHLFTSTAITDRCDQGEVVKLDSDELGFDFVVRDQNEVCDACESPYRRTHLAQGSRCYHCNAPWYQGSFS